MPTITFKVSAAEASLIRARAKQERASLSEYLRRRATGVDVPQIVAALGAADDQLAQGHRRDDVRHRKHLAPAGALHQGQPGLAGKVQRRYPFV